MAWCAPGSQSASKIGRGQVRARPTAKVVTPGDPLVEVSRSIAIFDHRPASRTRAIRSWAANMAMVGAAPASTSTLTMIDVPSAAGVWSMTLPTKMLPASLSLWNRRLRPAKRSGVPVRTATADCRARGLVPASGPRSRAPQPEWLPRRPLSREWPILRRDRMRLACLQDRQAGRRELRAAASRRAA